MPKMDEILAREEILKLLDENSRKIVVEAIRQELDLIREKILQGNLDLEGLKSELEGLKTRVEVRVAARRENSLKRVVNATGTIIHTNLGRSLISEPVLETMKSVSKNYSNLEYDLINGTRGSRYSHLEDIITEITGAEAAMVVNNNAAAVMLVLNTMAKDREIIVSRGELIEIGGSFRIPDVMEQSGGELVEVGTTNKTHLEDYENAITEETAAFLKVHTSNYKILGFTSGVGIRELVELEEKYDLPVIEDLGSGVLIDLSKYGLDYEPTVQDSVEAGADIVTFSGDKLLGGPQAGIIVGKKEYIDAMKKNQLTRALRVDKFTIAALESTFRLYLDEEEAVKEIPTLKMLTESIDSLEERAELLYQKLNNLDNRKLLNIEKIEVYSEVGGGSLPLERIKSRGLALEVENHSLNKLEEKLRSYEIPIVARISQDRLIMDLRTISKDDIEIVEKGLAFALAQIEEV